MIILLLNLDCYMKLTMKESPELSNEEKNAAFMQEIPKFYSELGLELLTQICGSDKRPRARMFLKVVRIEL